jgi:threonine synthase
MREQPVSIINKESAQPMRYNASVAPSMNPRFRGITCFACGAAHPLELQTVCRSCAMPLRANYALDGARLAIGREQSLWRYRDVLPITAGEVSLVEGWTPLIATDEQLMVKDESRNPTGSFKARGLCLAVSMAKALGARALQAPSAGNAASALAAYGAAARLPVIVAMPSDTPRPFVEECRHYGAEVQLVDGTIADAGKWLREHGPRDAFDVSTLKEPWRVEGKKTMAYELYEQLDGALPDWILYPTGGGTGLVGMWKAFDELERMKMIGSARPRLVSVQAAGCAPVVSAFLDGRAITAPWPDARTSAYGLRVPSPIGGFLCLRALRETGGTAIAVEESAIAPAARALAARTGLDICPEGGAAYAAYHSLVASGTIGARDRVVLFNTGTGLKYR